jgi:hypothetical protein
MASPKLMGSNMAGNPSVVTEIVENLMLFKVDVLIHIPVPHLQDRQA